MNSKLTSFLNVKIYNATILITETEESAGFYRLVVRAALSEYPPRSFIEINLTDIVGFDEENSFIETKDEIFVLAYRDMSFWSMLRDKTGLIDEYSQLNK